MRGWYVFDLIELQSSKVVDAMRHGAARQHSNSWAGKLNEEQGMDNKRCVPRWWIGMMAAIFFSITGCHGMAITAQDKHSSDSHPHNAVADWPLKFVQHNFGMDCYSTTECFVFYSNLGHTESKSTPSRDSAHPDALKNASASHVGIMNFPEPALVRWKSSDGTALEAEVDIGGIFKNRLILHETPREDIKENVSILNPDIILEVNDRTINVYMRARIPTKSLRSLDRPHSDYRRDLVLAWSRTY